MRIVSRASLPVSRSASSQRGYRPITLFPQMDGRTELQDSQTCAGAIVYRTVSVTNHCDRRVRKGALLIVGAGGGGLAGWLTEREPVIAIELMTTSASTGTEFWLRNTAATCRCCCCCCYYCHGDVKSAAFRLMGNSISWSLSSSRQLVMLNFELELDITKCVSRYRLKRAMIQLI